MFYAIQTHFCFSIETCNLSNVGIILCDGYSIVVVVVIFDYGKPSGLSYTGQLKK